MPHYVLAIVGWLNIQSIDFTNPLTKLLESLRRRREIKKSIKELNALSDHELNDIGISRGDIYSVAHASADMARSNENLKGWV